MDSSRLRAIIRETTSELSDSGDAWFARAPGRLDVLGGVADYSGARVLEFPLACGTWAAVSRHPGGPISVRTTTEGLSPGSRSFPPEFLFDATPEQIGERLRDLHVGWMAYALGPIAVLVERHGMDPDGFTVLVGGDVPVGAGVASSAAVEVAVLLAAAAAFGIEMEDEAVPRFAQEAEHRVASAPCGLMDQVTVHLGEEGALLPLTCRPMACEASAPLPRGLAVSGVHSGVRHAVGGRAYGEARAAAFMSHRLLGAGASWLAEVPKDRVDELPLTLDGAAFLARYREHGDSLTTVDPAVAYPVRAAAAHAILETERVENFLAALSRDDPVMAGEQLSASHRSYGALGLGSSETDLLHALVGELGPRRGLYGSRVSGGGSGGTVCVLHDIDAGDALEEVLARYGSAGHAGALLTGSSPGARAFGVHRW